jgi:hypothetical protein
VVAFEQPGRTIFFVVNLLPEFTGVPFEDSDSFCFEYFVHLINLSFKAGAHLFEFVWPKSVPVDFVVVVSPLRAAVGVAFASRPVA